MILFEPGPPTPPLHRRHPAVYRLDRIIRWAQVPLSGMTGSALPAVEEKCQAVRAALVGKPLRPHTRHGKYARQKRLAL